MMILGTSYKKLNQAGYEDKRYGVFTVIPKENYTLEFLDFGRFLFHIPDAPTTIAPIIYRGK